MKQAINLSEWTASGDAVAHPSGNGLGVKLQADSAGAFAKISFLLPLSVWHQQIRATIRLRLVDPWQETITFGLSDARGAITLHRQLTADPMLSKLVIENHCGDHPVVFFSINGPFTRLRFYIEDLFIEEVNARSITRPLPTLRLASPLSLSRHTS
jgi:hypothetical protein